MSDGKKEQQSEAGRLGGVARAASLTKTERRESASLAARSRWLRAEYEGTLGAGDIPCYVLSDGRRVLSQGGMLTALGMTKGSNPRLGGDRLANFIAGNSIKPSVSEELATTIKSPIRFMSKSGGTPALGYAAPTLVDLCKAVLAARTAKQLHHQQEHIAQRCEALVSAFAGVGIVALVDEATGYQEHRAKDALAKILDQFIAKELQPWVSTFPDDFYGGLFRLRGLDFPRDTVKRPRYFGHLTNDLVYERLAPGVLDELKRITPRDENGNAKHRYFQRLTANTGYRKLTQHLGSVVTVMKLSDGWQDFMAKMDRVHPRYGSTLEMFPDEPRTGI